jgi:phage/plasmid-like protein (TIGR03299 family)
MLSSLIKSPWQKYAAPVTAMTTAAALTAAKLDWRVNQSAAMFIDDQDTEHTLPGRFVNWRRTEDGKAEVMGVVSSDYVVIQNEEAFGVLDAALAGSNAQFTAGGIAGNRVFLQAFLPNQAISVIRGSESDAINRYILVSTSHDGGSALKIVETPIRVRCYNTLLMAENSDDTISVRHTGDARKQVDEIRMIMDLGYRRLKDVEAILQSAANTPINEETFINFITAVYPLVSDRDDQTKKRNVGRSAFEQMAQAFLQGMGNRGETLYDAYNAVTEYVDHRRGVDPGRWVEYTAFGAGAQMKRNALSLVTNAMGSSSPAAMEALIETEAGIALKSLERSRN